MAGARPGTGASCRNRRTEYSSQDNRQRNRQRLLARHRPLIAPQIPAWLFLCAICRSRGGLLTQCR